MKRLPPIKTAAIGVFFVLFFIARPVGAANISLEAKSQSFTRGEEFLMSVFMDTEEESVNAIEGMVLFPADLLEAREIRDGNSSINFWIEKPHILRSGIIAFSGITPGGLLSPKEFIFSVIFRAKKDGGGTIQIDGLRVLLNDGGGTPASIQVSPLPFSISQEVLPISPAIELIKDVEPPEDFQPTIESDPSIFDGKYFLVFTTQDKMSGMANYKVREGELGWFSVAESPYLLKYQSLDRKIFVKAIDKAHNERTAVLEPQRPTPWYRQYIIFAILLVVVVAGSLFKKLWGGFSR